MADTRRQKRESANLVIGQLKLPNLRNRKKNNKSKIKKNGAYLASIHIS